MPMPQTRSRTAGSSHSSCCGPRPLEQDVVHVAESAPHQYVYRLSDLHLHQADLDRAQAATAEAAGDVHAVEAAFPRLVEDLPGRRGWQFAAGFDIRLERPQPRADEGADIVAESGDLGADGEVHGDPVGHGRRGQCRD
jgi:hypothetical protein